MKTNKTSTEASSKDQYNDNSEFLIDFYCNFQDKTYEIKEKYERIAIFDSRKHLNII